MDGKIMALAIALVMCMMMSATAFAATITINPAEGWDNDENTAAETYTAYKILDVTFADGTVHGVDNTNIETAKGDTAGYSYYVLKASPWASVVTEASFFKTTEKDDRYLVELADGLTADAAQAQTMAAYFKENKPETAEAISLTVDADTHVATSETIADGYYYIESNVGEKLILATSDIEITEKNSYPTVTKTTKTTDAVAQIGTDVEFTIVVTVPKGADKAITLTDTMSKGLTFDSIVSVKNDDDETVAYTPASITATDAEDDATQFTMTFSAADVKANAEGTITVVYKAKVNKDAAVYTDIPNEVKLDYGTFSQTDSDKTKTAAFEILKYDGSDVNKTPIADAVFNLKIGGESTYINLIKVSDTVYRVADATETTGTVQDITTVAGTKITVNGLDSDITYKLVEKTAPTGFNKITGDIDVEVDADSAKTTEIENNKGTELPSTGGIGTTIFYVIGAVLVIGAGVLLVTRRRMRVE